MTTQHTPGPWKLGREDYAYFEHAKETIKHSAVGIDGENGDTDLARVVIGDPFGAGRANAELIASAPALLSEVATLRARVAELETALQAMVDAWDGRRLKGLYLIDNARAALAGKGDK